MCVGGGRGGLEETVGINGGGGGVSFVYFDPKVFRFKNMSLLIESRNETLTLLEKSPLWKTK